MHLKADIPKNVMWDRQISVLHSRRQPSLSISWQPSLVSPKKWGKNSLNYLQALMNSSRPETDHKLENVSEWLSSESIQLGKAFNDSLQKCKIWTAGFSELSHRGRLKDLSRGVALRRLVSLPTCVTSAGLVARCSLGQISSWGSLFPMDYVTTL